MLSRRRDLTPSMRSSGVRGSTECCSEGMSNANAVERGSVKSLLCQDSLCPNIASVQCVQSFGKRGSGPVEPDVCHQQGSMDGPHNLGMLPFCSRRPIGRLVWTYLVNSFEDSPLVVAPTPVHQTSNIPFPVFPIFTTPSKRQEGFHFGSNEQSSVLDSPKEWFYAPTIPDGDEQLPFLVEKHG